MFWHDILDVREIGACKIDIDLLVDCGGDASSAYFYFGR